MRATKELWTLWFISRVQRRDADRETDDMWKQRSHFIEMTLFWSISLPSSGICFRCNSGTPRASSHPWSLWPTRGLDWWRPAQPLNKSSSVAILRCPEASLGSSGSKDTKRWKWVIWELNFTGNGRGIIEIQLFGISRTLWPFYYSLFFLSLSCSIPSHENNVIL